MESDLPFTLHTIVPQHTVHFSELTANDPIRDRLFSGRILMVREQGEVEIDNFFKLLDEVSTIVHYSNLYCCSCRIWIVKCNVMMHRFVHSKNEKSK